MTWLRSSFCDANGCVEVAAHCDEVLVRDSKDPDGPVLRYTREEFSAFIAGAKLGEFDVD